jgi:Uma2 family endonuclease
MSDTATERAARATIDDLYRVQQKAELVGGRIVIMSPAGYQDSRWVKAIFKNLDTYVTQVGIGEVFPDNLGYQIAELPGSNRQSFAPDVSFYDGPLPEDLTKFVPGPPTFAVEVRSPEEYGPAAERQLADKRADYFAAGTKVVWDVDLKGRQVFVYRADDPSKPTVYASGQTAEAEPAVPGWSMTVDEVFQ